MGKPKQPKEKDQAKVPTAGTGDANNEGTTNEGESSHAKYGLRINQFKAKSQIVFPTLDLDGILVVLAEHDSDHTRVCSFGLIPEYTATIFAVTFAAH